MPLARTMLVWVPHLQLRIRRSKSPAFVDHPILLSWPVSQIACGDILQLSVPGHLETPSLIDKRSPMWSSAPFPEMPTSSGRASFRLTTSADPDSCVRWQADIPKWLSVQRQHLLILNHASGGKRIYPSDYPYKDNISWSWSMRQVAGGYTQVIICTKTTSADLDPCVRWQQDIAKWLSVQRQHQLILIHASGGRRIYLSDYLYKDNIYWSWPMRQVAGEYTQVIIRTKTTSVDPDPCVRWQTNIPKWLSVQRQHLLILTHASGGRRIYPSDYSYKDNIC